MRPRAAVLTLTGAFAVAGIGWILYGSSPPDPAGLGTQIGPSETLPLKPVQVESGLRETLEPGGIVAQPTEAKPAPALTNRIPSRMISVYDEAAASLPAEALIALILEEGKVIREAEGNRTTPLSRENMIASTRFELKRLVEDPRWNPSGQPLSDAELAFASSTLADHDEFVVMLKAQLLRQKDRAWESSVTLGLFAEREPPQANRDLTKSSKDAVSAQIAASRAQASASLQKLEAQLGQLWKDWTYVSLGAAGRSFHVYCTPATAPEVFSTSARIGTLRGQRRQWVRTYFLDRRPVRPDYLPPR